jgi:hypothetical protein
MTCVPKIVTPSSWLDAMTLRAAAVVPPTRLLLAVKPRPSISTPLPSFGTPAVPARFVPM